MTITEIYTGFGYLVRIADVLKVFGGITTDDKIEEFYNDFFDFNGWARYKCLELDGTKFILRSLTHDYDIYCDYFVLGLENFETTLRGKALQLATYYMAKRNIPWELIDNISKYVPISNIDVVRSILTRHPKWSQCIDIDSLGFYSATDDCRCCS